MRRKEQACAYTIERMKKRISKTTASKAAPVKAVSEASPITLSVDIGGTGLKMMVLDPAGKPVTERLRMLTPKNPTPDRKSVV